METMRRYTNRKAKRRPKKTEKSVAWDWMSRWVRLSAVVTLSNKMGFDPYDRMGECYTCGKIGDVKYMDAGHFKSRDIGGSSGLYFHEKAIRLQCKNCNAHRQGCPTEFRANLVKEFGKHGEAAVQELERLHRLPSRWGPREFPGLILYYQAEVQKLLDETGIERWWS